MDIYCRFCGEPWDHDELHDMSDWIEQDITYKQAAKRFRELGCNAWKPDTGLLRERAGLPAKPKHCTLEPIEPAHIMQGIGIMQDLSPYLDEWGSPDDIECMYEFAETL